MPAYAPLPLTPQDGFVFAATGDLHRGMARRAALRLREVMNRDTVGVDPQIDLYTDAAVDWPVFDRVHRLERGGTRPKFEALLRARFARTVYLDTDIVAVAPCADLFTILRKADLVGAHEQYGAAPVALRRPWLALPMGFRQINGGVIGVRRSRRMRRFLRAWAARFDTHGTGLDQPALAELLWEWDLRLWVLPSEYNLMATRSIRHAAEKMTAPRLLHFPGIKKNHAETAMQDAPYRVETFLAPETLRALEAKLAADPTLAPQPLSPRQARDLLLRANRPRLSALRIAAARLLARLRHRCGRGTA